MKMLIMLLLSLWRPDAAFALSLGHLELKCLAFLSSVYSEKRFSTSSAIISAMAREEVAAGDGALRTWRTRLPTSPTPPSKTKSSTRFPSRSRAWARTPAGPLQRKTSRVKEAPLNCNHHECESEKIVSLLYLSTSLSESSGMYFCRILTWAPMKTPLYISPSPYVMFLSTSFWRPLQQKHREVKYTVWITDRSFPTTFN